MKKLKAILMLLFSDRYYVGVVDGVNIFRVVNGLSVDEMDAMIDDLSVMANDLEAQEVAVETARIIINCEYDG